MSRESGIVGGDRLRGWSALVELYDPITALERSRVVPAAMPEPPVEAVALVRDWKTKHYAAWIDDPIPALDGQTPRLAVGTAAGRARVDVLLKDLENRESRLPEGERYDVRELRTQRGLARE